MKRWQGIVLLCQSSHEIFQKTGDNMLCVSVCWFKSTEPTHQDMIIVCLGFWWLPSSLSSTLLPFLPAPSAVLMFMLMTLSSERFLVVVRRSWVTDPLFGSCVISPSCLPYLSQHIKRSSSVTKPFFRQMCFVVVKWDCMWKSNGHVLSYSLVIQFYFNEGVLSMYFELDDNCKHISESWTYQRELKLKFQENWQHWKILLHAQCQNLCFWENRTNRYFLFNL